MSQPTSVANCEALKNCGMAMKGACPPPERVEPETLAAEANHLTRISAHTMEMAVRIYRKTLGDMPPEPPIKICRNGVTGRLDEVENYLTILNVLLSNLEDAL